MSVVAPVSRAVKVPVPRSKDAFVVSPSSQVMRASGMGVESAAWATALIAPYLSPEGFVVWLQNCLNEERIAGIVGVRMMNSVSDHPVDCATFESH